MTQVSHVETEGFCMLMAYHCRKLSNLVIICTILNYLHVSLANTIYRHLLFCRHLGFGFNHHLDRNLLCHIFDALIQ